MLRKEIGKSEGAIWLDIINPDIDALETLSNEFKIALPILKSCLDPEHLPKYEMFENGEYYILRCFDESCQSDADTTQELTRKIVIIRSKNYLITIHRSPMTTLDLVANRWVKRSITEADLITIVYELFRGSLKSYDRPVDTLLDQLESLEMSIFDADGAKPFNLKEGYLLKRKSFVFKRLINAISETANQIDFSKKTKNHLKEERDTLIYYCDEMIESTNSLLNLHISLASQKTNEVVRVLTIFSMFLLPLNVITGIYGMNFDVMPELNWPHGYYYSLGLMVVTLIIIFIYFRSKGWLKGH
jgi:magnesium transporter